MSYSQRQLMPVDGPVPDSPRPLYEATSTCFKAFEDCLDFDHDWKTGVEAIMEQESRLFRWGRLTGVLRDGGDCLDARLSHHKHVSNRMLAFLYNIANQIASARLGDDADEPYRSSLRIPAIEAAIDDLFCLSDEIQRWVEKWPQLNLVHDDETMTDTADTCQEQAGTHRGAATRTGSESEEAKGHGEAREGRPGLPCGFFRMKGTKTTKKQGFSKGRRRVRLL